MDERIEKTVDKLKKHSFKAVAARDKAEALEIAMKLISDKATVGIPGSASVRAIGLVEALKERGNEIYDHWDSSLSPADAMKIRKQQATADVLVTSANGLAMTGEIVNMDGVGNRVAPTIWGPGRVIFVVGRNKISDNLEAARNRAKNVAAPIRSKELNIKNPCVEKGECIECSAPTRICRAEVILHRAPSLTDIHVILVDEDLGN